jgi:hypothetical protein
MNLFAAIVKHSVSRASFDNICDTVARSISRFFKVLPVKFDNFITEQREDYDHSANKADGKFEAKVNEAQKIGSYLGT